MIPVTKTFLPPQRDYDNYLKQLWATQWITNRGTLVVELEHKLNAFLGTTHVLAMTNGTLALQIAIKSLELTGDIITTPFSYVATSSSIVWEGCQPVFVDIHPDYLTIDETKIEAAITPRTSAILATHVFGNPCHIEIIEAIAKRHQLKVIYDAAHCFGVTYKGESIFNYGDVSTCSFHATKLFHTGEGGATFTKDKGLYDKLFYHHNFGHKGPDAFQGLGINAKMSELQAAMGLAVLPHVKFLIDQRQKIVEHYHLAFEHSDLKTMVLRNHTRWNFSYYPVLFSSEQRLLKVKNELEKHNVFPRRYFYPSLHTLPYLKKQNVPQAEAVSSTIMCLPLYDSLTLKEQDMIIELIHNAL